MAATQYPQFDARVIGRTLWRWAWLIAALTGVAFVGTYLLVSLQPKVYAATADVAIKTSDPIISGTRKQTDPAILGTEAYNLRSSAVRAAAFARLGPDAKKIVSVSSGPISNTTIVQMTVTSRSPKVAAEAANAYVSAYQQVRTDQLTQSLKSEADSYTNQAGAFTQRARELQDEVAADPHRADASTILQSAKALNTLAGQSLAAADQATVAAVGETSTITITKYATPSNLPVSPTPLRDAGIAGAVGLVFGIGLAFLLEQLDNRIKTADQIAQVTGGLTLLASIPEYSDGTRHFSHRFHRAERALVPPTSVAAESYHALATSLRFSSLGKEKRTILVTSSVGEEGKTTVTANLAAVLAESGFRVVVVSADLRRPMLGELLHSTETEKGLTSAMLGDRDLASCFISVPLPSGKNIFVLPAGPLPHEPAVLLGSDMFGTVLDQIKRSQADFILIDCAPVLPVSDPVAASRHVDGVIVLALHGETRQSDLAETVKRLRQVDADIIGVVLNGVPVSRGRFDYYGYYGYRPYTPDASNGNGSGMAKPAATKPSAPEQSAGRSEPMVVKRSEPEPGGATA
jgi:capsular exopolysaccharide synthesis family protein